MASKSARMRGSAHLKAVTVAQQKSYVISSVFCENSAGHDETATRLYLPIRAGRLHEVCTNDFYLLTHYVRSQKDRLFFALRALGATVKLLKIRFRPGQPGPAIHVARIFHVTVSYEGLDSQIACQTSYLYLYLAWIAAWPHPSLYLYLGCPPRPV